MTPLAEHPVAKRRGNRLTDIDGVSYVWDAKGNLIQAGNRALAYDHANRLIEVSHQGAVYEFSYNGLGDRLAQSFNGAATQYTLDLNAGLTQVLADGTNTYLYGLNRVGQYGAGGWAYHLPDALGSIRQMADPGASVALARAYEPFGVQMAMAGPAASPYGFAGEWRDRTGLVHLRARYYPPYLGQFISPDPFSGISLRPMTLHPYTYGFENPVNSTDPSGGQGIGPTGGWGSSAIVTCFGIAFAIPEPFFVEEGICTLVALGVVTAAALPVITQGPISARNIADTAVETTENGVDQCKVTWQYLLQNVAPKSDQEPEPGPQPQWAPLGPNAGPSVQETPRAEGKIFRGAGRVPTPRDVALYRGQDWLSGLSFSTIPLSGQANIVYSVPRLEEAGFIATYDGAKLDRFGRENPPYHVSVSFSIQAVWDEWHSWERTRENMGRQDNSIMDYHSMTYLLWNLQERIVYSQ